MLTKQQKEKLVSAAMEARKRAYAPYSKYAVGAALLTSSGEVYTGVNIENAAYPSSMCAERVAVFKAVSDGIHDIRAIAVVTQNAGSPCGACRQVLAEFGMEIIVLIANTQGDVIREVELSELLPGAFTASFLEGSEGAQGK